MKKHKLKNNLKTNPSPKLKALINAFAKLIMEDLLRSPPFNRASVAKNFDQASEEALSIEFHDLESTDGSMPM